MSEVAKHLVERLYSDKWLKEIESESFLDRFSFRYSVSILLLMFTVLTTAAQIKKPMACYLQEAPASTQEFITNFCWVESKIVVPYNVSTPTTRNTWNETNEIVFYQWIPFFIGLQCLFFYLPHYVWRSFVEKIKLTEIAKNLGEATSAATTEDRTKNIKDTANILFRQLVEKRNRPFTSTNNRFKLFCSRFTICIPLFVKLLYFVTAIFQVWFLYRMLSLRSVHTGDITRKLFTMEWHTVFPRTVMCPVSVRQIGSVNQYTAICVLPMIVFAEHCYKVIFTWCCFMCLISACSLLQFIGKIFSILLRRRTLYEELSNMVKEHTNYLEKHGDEDDEEEEKVKNEQETAKEKAVEKEAEQTIPKKLEQFTPEDAPSILQPYFKRCDLYMIGLLKQNFGRPVIVECLYHLAVQIKKHQKKSTPSSSSPNASSPI